MVAPFVYGLGGFYCIDAVEIALMLRILCFLSFLIFSNAALAKKCIGDVELISSKLLNNKFVTSWRVQHDAGHDQLATVYFEYKINYINKLGHELVERGVFRELIKGQGKQYTEETISMHNPTSIITIDFDAISCFD